MKLKSSIICPYCQARAKPRREPALTLDKVRYGCANEHYFAVLKSAVEVKEAP